MAEKIINKSAGKQDKKAYVRNALQEYCIRKGEECAMDFEKSHPYSGGFFGLKRRNHKEDCLVKTIKNYLLESIKAGATLNNVGQKNGQITTNEQIEEIIKNAPLGRAARKELRKWPAKAFLQVAKEKDFSLVKKDGWIDPSKEMQSSEKR